ncbi:MAG TPA: hypothetical protein VGH73_09475 [Thermoanaerobaculia bacterium]|jgi:hypothetical protein
MSKRIRVKLLGVLVVLGAVAGILGSEPRANALLHPCCSYCDNLYNECLAKTIYPACNGNASCCLETLDPCYNTCNTSC